MGDGILVEFPSVVEAVECAVAIQRGMISRNEGIQEDQQIKFRIGINLGDILIESDDILGDGVNIAARLQEQADPNGICISSTVFNHIDGKIDHKFADAGAHQFKNIANAIRVYKRILGTSTETVQVAFRPFIDLPVEKKPLATGGCMCGNIQYEVTGKTLGSMLCHCRMCQRFSGAQCWRALHFQGIRSASQKGNQKFINRHRSRSVDFVVIAELRCFTEEQSNTGPIG